LVDAWFVYFMRRAVRRAAWFLWITPAAAALPMRFCAAVSLVSASSACSAAACCAVFTRVFSSDRTATLRTRRFSFWRFRFF
jgi:hypothetical protein